MFRILAAFTFALAIQAQDHSAIIDAVRQKAVQYARDLPNFVCNQETLRERDTSGTLKQWKNIDTLVEQLTYFDHREKYEVLLVNGRPAKTTRARLGNVLTTGEFGSVLRHTFDPATQTVMAWERQDVIDGRPVNVLTFRVPQATSKATMSWNGKRITTGFHGLVFADVATNSVLRLTLVNDIPDGFAIRGAGLQLDYGFVEIANQTYLLPVRSESYIRRDKTINRNIAVFTRYRKFDAAANIKFDPQ